MGRKINWIFFDCMETLVDLTELPKLRDYAAWAYADSGTEAFFGGFDPFFRVYLKAREEITARLRDNQEHEMLERLELAAALADGGRTGHVKQVAKALYDNYWENYKSRCYVKEDVRDVLAKLSGRFKLGVVSNFMVGGGIEELLDRNDIRKYFDFVTTSIEEGWRKPHRNIYAAALRVSGASVGEVLFSGDDYINDYVTPKELGMKAVLLDRSGRYVEVAGRAADFYALEEMIDKIAENSR